MVPLTVHLILFLLYQPSIQDGLRLTTDNQSEFPQCCEHSQKTEQTIHETFGVIVLILQVPVMIYSVQGFAVHLHCVLNSCSPDVCFWRFCYIRQTWNQSEEIYVEAPFRSNGTKARTFSSMELGL